MAGGGGTVADEIFPGEFMDMFSDPRRSFPDLTFDFGGVEHLP